jgi:hypothetical protein
MYSKRRQLRKQTKSRSGRRKTQRGGKTWQEIRDETKRKLEEGTRKASGLFSMGNNFLQEKIEDVKGNASTAFQKVADKVGEIRGNRENLTSEQPITELTADAPSSLEDTTLQQPDTTTQTDDKVTLATLQDQVNNVVKFVSSLFDELRAPIVRKEFNNDDYRRASFNRLLELKTKTLNPEP